MSNVATQDPAEDPPVDTAPVPSAADGVPLPTSFGRLRAVGPGRDPESEPVSSADAAQQAVEHLAVSRSPLVLSSDVWAEAGRKVLAFHLSRMLARVPGTIAGEDPEEVHAMRVAARRVRAAWRVFGGAYERSVMRDHVSQLRTLGGRLGAVRDLDVQSAILIAHRGRRSKRERAALSPLLDAWTAQRADRHRELVERLSSPWFTAFVTDHESLVTTPGAAVRPVVRHAPATVRMRAPSVAWEAYQAVWGFDDAIDGADFAMLHELRIAAKWLRYTLEFVREPMEPGATELIRRVVVLQDHLGDIHDLHASAALARSFAADDGHLRPGQRTAIERFAVAQDLRVERLRRRLGPAWRGVADPEYRRGLGRALARP